MSHNTVFAPAAATVLLPASFVGPVVYLPQHMEKTLGYSAMGAGAGMPPMMVTFAGTSFIPGPAYNRLGARMVVATRASLLMVGMVLLSFLSASAGYGSILPGMLVLGVGTGLFYSATTTTGVTAVDTSQASLAGGIISWPRWAAGRWALG